MRKIYSILAALLCLFLGFIAGRLWDTVSVEGAPNRLNVQQKAERGGFLGDVGTAELASSGFRVVGGTAREKYRKLQALLSLDVSEFESASSRVMKNESVGARRLYVEAIYELWGEANPELAIASAREIGEPAFASLALRSALKGWAASSPEAAWSWALKQPDGVTRELKVELFRGAVEGMLESGHTSTAARLVESLEGDSVGRDLVASHLLASWAELDSDAVTAWLTEGPGGPSKLRTSHNVIRDLLKGMVGMDPINAMNWAASVSNGSDGKQQGHSALRIAPALAMEQWMWQGDYTEAVDWLSAQRPEDVSAIVYSAVGQNLIDIEPDLAIRLLSGINDAEVRDDGIQVASDRMVRQSDHAKALEWLQLLADEERRVVKSKELYRRWLILKPGEAKGFLRMSPSLSEETKAVLVELE